MRWTAVFVPVFGIVGLSIAQSDEPIAPSAQAVPRVTLDAARWPPPAQYPVRLATVSEKNSEADYIDHLRNAAEHLQAAGLNSLADHIRGLSNTQIVGGPPKDGDFTEAPKQLVLFQIKLLELEKENLRRWGLDFSQTQLIKGLPSLNGPVEALPKDGLVRVLAEPTLVTVMGRPAQYHCGGEVKLWDIGPDGTPVQRLEQYGTCVNLVARQMDKCDLRIELTLECSEVDRTKTVLVAGKENPAILKRVVRTDLEIKLGETFALSCPWHAAGGGATDSASTVVVMIVTAEAVEPMAAVQPTGRLGR